MAMAFICVKDISGTTDLETWNFVHMTSITSCIVGKKIRAMGPGPLELFPFVVLAILMAMAGGISEHMLTSWSSERYLDVMTFVINFRIDVRTKSMLSITSS